MLGLNVSKLMTATPGWKEDQLLAKLVSLVLAIALAAVARVALLKPLCML
jgi:hypothetical protein